MEYVGFAVAVVAAFLFAAGVWRFVRVRNSGAQAMVRVLPAEGAHGWRHGVMRYDGDDLEFFKLRSLSFSHDAVLNRRGVQFDGFRDVTEAEREFMPDIGHVLQLSGPSGQFEFAADRHTEMGLISWIESAPDARQESVDKQQLLERAMRDTDR